MLNRRELLNTAAFAAIPASARSEVPPVVVSQDPPTIIQWLENPGVALMRLALTIVDQWRASGMKTTLSLPAEARLIQFINGRWISVLPEPVAAQSSHGETNS